MAGISVRKVRKVFDNEVVAVDDFSLDIPDKEFVVLVGPSGCGKSTMLRMLAGLEEVTDGEIWIGEQMMNNVPARDRDIAMVFQSYALYPHMTVYKNMSFGLENRHLPKAEIDKKVREAARLLGIENLLGRKPKAMSGGQRQRVALGRAMVREPAVFLLDEPLSNLDAKLRSTTRMEIIKLHRRLDATFVYVTHDQVEAMTMGDRIVVMKDGLIQQSGAPQEIYDHPQNIFVAGFIGNPPMNFLNATLEQAAAGWQLRLESGAAVALGATRQLAAENAGRQVVLGIRPDRIRLSETGSVTATLEVVEALGGESNLYFDHQGARLTVRLPGAAPARPDAVLNLLFEPEAIHLFDKETTRVIE